MSAQVSSTTLHYPEFNNSTEFIQHFKKRPFDENTFGAEETAEKIHNAYKKIKTTPSVKKNSSLSPQRTTQSAKTPFTASYYSLGLSRYIDLRDDENVEVNSLSDVPRIIDLSTGESLDSIPSLEQLQRNRKPKRPIELVENQDEISTTEANKDIDDLMKVEGLLHSHKRIRSSKEHMCNFIEEEEEIVPRVHGPAVNIINELKNGSNTFSSNKANVISTEKPQSSQSLSLCVHGRDLSNIKFTVPYQKAMNRYIRSQFQHLNNEEYENEGKQIVLYHTKNEDENDSHVKISEILEEAMDFDVEAGQNGVVSCDNVMQVDQMDID